MDALFGDATTAMPTPAQHAEVESLMSGGARSPVPSLDIRRPGNFTTDNAIPGLDINPPTDSGDNSKPQMPPEEPRSEGLGGWISRIAQRAKGDGKKDGGGGYGRLGQDED